MEKSKNYAERLRKLQEEMFSLDPASDEYFDKFVDSETSNLYKSIDDDDFMDNLYGFRQKNLSSDAEGSSGNERGLAKFSDDPSKKTNLFSQYIGSKFGEGGEGGGSSENPDFLSNILGEKDDGNAATNAMSLINNTIGISQTQANSKSAVAAQTGSSALSGAKLGMSVGGPLGATIGGVAGGLYGFFDGKNDLKKIEEEKKKEYQKVLSEIKENRKRNYMASDGLNSINTQ